MRQNVTALLVIFCKYLLRSCVEEKIKAILCEISGEESIDSEASLQEDLALDSLAMVTMLIEIEDVFEIQLDESDMNPFDLTTVQEVVDMVSKYRGCADE